MHDFTCDFVHSAFILLVQGSATAIILHNVLHTVYILILEQGSVSTRNISHIGKHYQEFIIMNS